MILIKRFLYKLIKFICSTVNIVILISLFILTKLGLIFKNFSFIKKICLGANHLLFNEAKIRRITAKVVNFIIYWYTISFLLLVTFLVYLFISVFFTILNVHYILGCTKAFLLCFLYITITLLFTKDSNLDRIFELNRFNYERQYEFKYRDWHDINWEYSGPFHSADSTPEVEFQDDIYPYIKRYKNFDNYLNFVEAPIHYAPETNLYQKLTDSKHLVDDLYLFERWSNLSNQLLDRFYKTREFKKFADKSEYFLFQQNKNIFIKNDHNFFMKYFNFVEKGKKIETLAELKQRFLQNHLLNPALSDNLIFNFTYFKLKLVRPRRQRSRFGFKKKPNLFNKTRKSLGGRNRYSFWGNGSIFKLNVNSLMQLNDLKLFNYKLLAKRSFQSNYINYILGVKKPRLNHFSKYASFVPHVGYNYGLNDRSLNFFTSKDKPVCFFKFSKTAVSLDFKLYNFFNKEIFFFLNFKRFPFILKEEDLKALLTNTVEQSQHWHTISSQYYPSFFEQLFDQILANVLTELTRPSGLTRINSVFYFLNKFIGKIIQIFYSNFQLKKKLNKRYLSFILKVVKLIPNYHFRRAQILRVLQDYYHTLLPEQFSYVPGRTDSFFLIDELYSGLKKKKNRVSFMLLFPNKVLSHFIIHRHSKKVYGGVIGRTPSTTLYKMFRPLNKLLINFYLSSYNTPLNLNISGDSLRFKTELSRRQNRTTSLSSWFMKFFYFIDSSCYWILYGLPYLFNNQRFHRILETTYKIQPKYQFRKDFQKIFRRVKTDLFFFPYLTSFQKVPDERNMFLQSLLENNEQLISYDSDLPMRAVIDYRLLKQLNNINSSILSRELLVLMVSTKRSNVEHWLRESTISLYNKHIYINSFINMILNPRKLFKINDLSELKQAISHYFVSTIYNFKLYDTADYHGFNLNLFDYEVLTTLGNKYWFWGIRGPISEYNKLGMRPYTIGKRGYALAGYDSNYQANPDTELVPLHQSIYRSRSVRTNYILSEIGKWLNQAVVFRQVNVIYDYMYFFSFIFYFWLVSRGRDSLDVSRSFLMDEINELGLYEEFTDYYKAYYPELQVTSGWHSLMGQTYTGTNRGYHHCLWPSFPGRQAQPLDEIMAEEFTYGGDKRGVKSEHFLSQDEFADVYYFLNEMRWNVDTVDNLITDFFRNEPRTNLNQLKNILRWKFYGKLNAQSNNMIDRSTFLFLRPTSVLKTQFLSQKQQINLNSIFSRSRRFNIRYQPGFYRHKAFVAGTKTNRISGRNFINFMDSQYLYNNINYYLSNFEEKFKSGIKDKKKIDLDRMHRTIAKSVQKAEYLEEMFHLLSEYHYFRDLQKPDRTVGVSPRYREARLLGKALDEFNTEVAELEDVVEMYVRVLQNFSLSVRQKFFYSLFYQTPAIDDARRNKYVLDNLNYKTLMPIFRSVTQYGEEINALYSDSIEYLPRYISFLGRFTPLERKDFLNRLPEFHKLVFDHARIFMFDPLLTNNSTVTSWFQTLYQNPYWLGDKTILVKQSSRPFIGHLRSKGYLHKLVYYWFGHGVDFEEALNLDGNVVLEKWLQILRNVPRPEDEMVHQYRLKFDNERQQLVRFNTGTSGTPISWYDYAPFVSNRSLNYDYKIIPVDPHFKVKGFVDVPRFDLISSLKTSIRSLLHKVNRSTENVQQSVFDQLSVKTHEYLRRPQLFDLNRSYKSYEEYDAEKVGLISRTSFPNFRKFNTNLYRGYAEDPLMELFSQYFENRQNFSDRLFEVAPNYGINQRIFRTRLDYPAFEEGSNDLWFDNEDYLSSVDRVQVFADSLAWPMLSRRVWGVAQGLPPLIFFPDNDPYPRLSNYIVRNGSIRPRGRFRDFINDEDPFEQVRIEVEDGSVAIRLLWPLYLYFSDWSVYFFSNFLKTVNNVTLLRTVRSVKGPGDFTSRSDFFQRFYLPKSKTLTKGRFNYFINPKAGLANSDLRRALASFQIRTGIELTNNFIIRLFLQCSDTFSYFWYNSLKQSDKLTNSYLISHNFHLAMFVFLLVFIHYTVWYPFTYLHSLIRDWINYPRNLEDLMHSDEINTDRSVIRWEQKLIEWNTLNDAGRIYLESDSGVILFDTIVALYEHDATAYESIVDQIVFKSSSESDLINYAGDLKTVLQNELIDLNTLYLPGYSFNYTLMDVIKLNELDFQYHNFTGSLAWYKAPLVEYLHTLTGFKMGWFDLKYRYMFLKNENLSKINNIKRFEGFSQYIKSGELFDDLLINSRRQTSPGQSILQQFALLSDNKEFLAPSHDQNPKSLTNERYLLSERNYILPTIWFSNKLFYLHLSMLRFSIDSLLNTDQFSLLLFSESSDVSNFLHTNLILQLSVNESFFFLSRNPLTNSQYKLGESLLPFYLRFSRFNQSSVTSSECSNPYYTKSLESFMNQNKSDVDLTAKLEVITPEDLMIVHSYKNEGVHAQEALFSVLLNLKTYFSRLIVHEEVEYYDELVLDFHNLEYHNYYSYNMITSLRSTATAAEDWISMIEESKEWLIFIDKDRILPLQDITYRDRDPYNTYEFSPGYSKRIIWRRFRRLGWLKRIKMIRNRKGRQDYSHYLITPSFPSARYYEEPIFPDPTFRFEFLFNRLPRSFDSLAYTNTLLNLLRPAPAGLLSEDLFCQAMALQYISTDVHYDVFLMLTPEGRAVNKRLSKMSSLQLYSYFNRHLILRRNRYLFSVASPHSRFLLQSNSTMNLDCKGFFNTRIFSLIVFISILMLLCF